MEYEFKALSEIDKAEIVLSLEKKGSGKIHVSDIAKSIYEYIQKKIKQLDVNSIRCKLYPLAHRMIAGFVSHKYGKESVANLVAYNPEAYEDMVDAFVFGYQFAQVSRQYDISINASVIKKTDKDFQEILSKHHTLNRLYALRDFGVDWGTVLLYAYATGGLTDGIMREELGLTDELIEMVKENGEKIKKVLTEKGVMSENDPKTN